VPFRRDAAEPPSIYEHLRAGRGDELPDEHLEVETVGMRFAPGAREGTLLRYAAAPEDIEERAADLHASLVRLADRPGPRAREQVRERFRATPPREVVDTLLDRLAAYPPRDPTRLYGELRSLLLTSGRRNEVKYALALVGSFAHADDADVLRVFARHGEFALYAAVALSRLTDDAEPVWRELLLETTGWGRTEIAELLLVEPSEETLDFVLRHGLGPSNAIELAARCRLYDRIARGGVDDELLDAVGAVLSALADPDDSPYGLADYPDALRAVERYLELLVARARTAEDLRRAEVVARAAQALSIDAPRRERIAALATEVLERHVALSDDG
jgi:hypothetical protein